MRRGTGRGSHLLYKICSRKNKSLHLVQIVRNYAKGGEGKAAPPANTSSSTETNKPKPPKKGKTPVIPKHMQQKVDTFDLSKPLKIFNEEEARLTSAVSPKMKKIMSTPEAYKIPEPVKVKPPKGAKRKKTAPKKEEVKKPLEILKEAKKAKAAAKKLEQQQQQQPTDIERDEARGTDGTETPLKLWEKKDYVSEDERIADEKDWVIRKRFEDRVLHEIDDEINWGGVLESKEWLKSWKRPIKTIPQITNPDERPLFFLKIANHLPMTSINKDLNKMTPLDGKPFFKRLNLFRVKAKNFQRSKKTFGPKYIKHEK